MVTVAELAATYNLKPTRTKGVVEFHGANFIDSGATDDGFILNLDGTAWDRALDRYYKSWDVAKAAGLDPKDFEPTADYMESNPSTGKAGKGPKQPKAYDTRSLEKRGYLPVTLGHFGIARKSYPDVGVFWQYPTYFADGRLGRSRRKFQDPNVQLKKEPDKNPSKYRWDFKTRHLGDPVGYNLNPLKDADLSQVELWIVNGEPSVWACHQEGVLAVCPLGEQRHLDQFVAALVEAGVTTAHYVPDNDMAGQSASKKISELGRLHGLEIVLHKWHLPSLKKGYDVCNLWEACRDSELPLAPALSSLPLADVIDDAPVEAPPKKAAGDKAASSSEQSGRLIMYLEDANMELFHTSDEEAFISLRSVKGVETVVIGSTKFEHLMDAMWREHEFLPLKQEALVTVSRILTGMAIRDGETIEVSPRVQARGTGPSQRIYLDLNNKKGQLIEVFAGGWRVVEHVEGVYFRKFSGMQPLPLPLHVAEENADDIWQTFRGLMGCRNEKDFALMVGWLLGCLRGPDQPYPALAVSGEQDSGKTEKTKMLRAIIDPNRLELADIPADERNLAISAKNRLILGYDNLVNIPLWLSNALCRIATMGCFSIKKLYSNDDEQLFHATRPLLINGIADFLGRPDFQRRCLFVQLPRFGHDGGTKKLSVKTVWRIFGEVMPSLLGLLLDAVGAAIEHSEDGELEDIDVGNGMIDFAEWVVAAELGGALPWPVGTFEEAYADSRQIAASSSMQDLLSASFQRFARHLRKTNKPGWKGNATELRDILLSYAAIILYGEHEYEQETNLENKTRMTEKGKEYVRRSKDFPSNPVHMGRDLKAIAPRLRENRIFDVRFSSGKSRLIELTLLEMGGNIPGVESEEATEETAPPDAGQAAPEDRDIFDDED